MPSFSQQEQKEHMMLKTSNSHQQANQQKYPHINKEPLFSFPHHKTKTHKPHVQHCATCKARVHHMPDRQGSVCYSADVFLNSVHLRSCSVIPKLWIIVLQYWLMTVDSWHVLLVVIIIAFNMAHFQHGDKRESNLLVWQSPLQHHI